MTVLFALTEEGCGSSSDAGVEGSMVSFKSLRLFRFFQGFVLLEPELIHALTFNLGHQKVPMPECAMHFLPIVFPQHSVPSSNAWSACCSLLPSRGKCEHWLRDTVCTVLPYVSREGISKVKHLALKRWICFMILPNSQTSKFLWKACCLEKSFVSHAISLLSALEKNVRYLLPLFNLVLDVHLSKGIQ